jgi:myosin heavy subunit
VRARHKDKLIYTGLSNILIAVNPYCDIGIYGEDYIDMYASNNPSESPHVFKVTSEACRQQKEHHMDQAIVISGESGAGKTETTKLCLKYITALAIKRPEKEALAAAGGASTLRRQRTSSMIFRDNLDQQIMDSNPILEAFGNAKTTRNDNSSRFGKWMQIHSQPESGKVLGCSLTGYMLEKSRVVRQGADERNFHIFYQMMKAGTPPFVDPRPPAR